MIRSLLLSFVHNPLECVDQVNNLLGNLEMIEEDGECSCKISREIVVFIDGCIWLKFLYSCNNLQEALKNRICMVTSSTGRLPGHRLDIEEGLA